jgi:hypothetical protein
MVYEILVCVLLTTIAALLAVIAHAARGLLAQGEARAEQAALWLKLRKRLVTFLETGTEALELPVRQFDDLMDKIETIFQAAALGLSIYNNQAGKKGAATAAAASALAVAGKDAPLAPPAPASPEPASSTPPANPSGKIPHEEVFGPGQGEPVRITGRVEMGPEPAPGTQPTRPIVLGAPSAKDGTEA